MTRRKLPIGVQTFRTVREDHCYYVDKTAYIRRLLDEGTHYFLSRPRRFGKSLFLDTCKELFEGNEPLFEGLAIHDRWDWSVRHPVLRLSFGSGNFKEPGYVHTNLMAQLDVLEEQLGVASRYDSAAERFWHLVRTSSAQAGQRAVVLVDEYDSPILDALDAPEVARANRDFLRGLYAVIKDRDAHIRFSFITGVSRSLQRGSARGSTWSRLVWNDPARPAGTELPEQPDGRDDQSGRSEDPPCKTGLHRREPSIEQVGRDMLTVLGRLSHGVGDRVRVLAVDAGVRQLADDGE